MKATRRILLSLFACSASLAYAQQPVVGLITKTETNPFFVKMKEGAMEEAKAKGAKLMSGAGKFDGDNAGQITALENMVTAGAKAILITPSDTKAIVPSIKKARDAGVLVIALDTPTDPQGATDALFATDNFKAGVLIGQYAKAAMAGKTAKIATLDLAPGITVGKLRHDGFLKGFGIKEGDPMIVCSQDTQGDQAKGQTAMENCLQKNPDIDVVTSQRDREANYLPRVIDGVGRIVRIEAPDKQFGRCLCISAKKNFGPRMGLAYRPGGSTRTVIRAGYGIGEFERDPDLAALREDDAYARLVESFTTAHPGRSSGPPTLGGPGRSTERGACA
jgi:ABC-type sugar transport system substrate-binding protein